MKRRVSFLLFFVSASLWAADPVPEKATTEELANKLQAAIAKVTKESKDDPKTSGVADPRRQEVNMYLGQILAAVKRAQLRGDTENLQQMIAQLQTLTATEEVNALCEALVDQIEKENREREKVMVDAVNAMVDKAVAACFAAKDPKELDDLIIELSKYSGRSNYDSREVTQRAASKASAAVNFLCRWQDYLSQAKSGNEDAATTLLISLSKETSNFPFVPRSEILARVKSSGVVAEGGMDNEAKIVLPSLKGKTLADVEDLKQQVREVQVRNRGNSQAAEMMQQLQALDRAQEELEVGQIGQAYSYCTGSSGFPRSSDLLPLRQQLLIQVLPPYLGVAKAYPAKEQETPVEYLERVIKEAREKREWVTLWKALEVYRGVAFGSQAPNWVQADISGMSQYIVGQNLEKAGQYVDAIRAYKRVLSQAGQYLPVEATTERLQALAKERPEDYAAASKPVEMPVRPQVVPGPNGVPQLVPR